MSAQPGRALILVENLPVPFDRRVWQECLALSAAGWEMSVICPQGTKRHTEAFERVEGVDIHRYSLATASGGPAGYAREYGRAFWQTRRIAFRLARTAPFDVVQACNPPDLLLSAVRRLKTRLGAAFVFDQHDLIPELYESRFGRGRDALYRLTVAAERRTYGLADVVISTNQSYRDVALTRGGKSRDDVFVVRSAPDAARFTPTAPDESLKRGRRHLIAYLGVMGPQDGIDHALRALAQLASRDDWQAVFMGEGDVLPAMRVLARELGLGERVDFTGRIPDEDVQRILSTATVGLAPDPKNPLNDVSTMNKILEYMAISCPVVSYDLVEARVSAGDAALYAVANDEASFAAAIARLLDDPELGARMGAVGRERINGALSWETSKRELLRAYERALSYRRP
jgi:glycosyltransferase involved in cell wall biosynthesis